MLWVSHILSLGTIATLWPKYLKHHLRLIYAKHRCNALIFSLKLWYILSLKFQGWILMTKKISGKMFKWYCFFSLSIKNWIGLRNLKTTLQVQMVLVILWQEGDDVSSNFSSNHFFFREKTWLLSNWSDVSEPKGQQKFFQAASKWNFKNFPDV